MMIYLKVIAIILLIQIQLFAANAGFSATQLTFKDGSGWKEVTNNICGDQIRVLQATGTTVLSNGIILDTTIGAVQSFIDESIIGMIMPFASSTLPSGWIPCDGRIIRVSATSNCEYQTLANRIRTTWGPTTTPGSMQNGKFVGRFQLPDLRGQFLRGALTLDNTGATTTAARESVVLEAANFRRFREPSFSTNVTFTSLNGTLGTYQPSGFTTHSNEHNFEIPTSNTTAVNETHDHPSTQISLDADFQFFEPSAVQDYDEPDGSAKGTNTYHGHSTSIVGNLQSVANSHTHTFNTNSLSFSNTNTLNSYPNNASVTFGIRY
jgi:microcystin-dependent protein